jgi:hypothetical protein
VGPRLSIYFGKKLAVVSAKGVSTNKEMLISKLILIEWYFRFFGANVAGLPSDWLKIMVQSGGIKHDF